MRWLCFAVLAYLVTVIQSTLLHHLELFVVHARPDLLILLAVFLTLWWNPPEALLGAWILGLCRDLVSAVPLGVSALSFGLVALAVLGVREVIFGENPLAQAAIALLFAFLVEWLVALHGHWWGWGGAAGLGEQTRRALFDAVYAAALAPYLFWLLLRVRPLYKARTKRAN